MSLVGTCPRVFLSFCLSALPVLPTRPTPPQMCEKYRTLSRGVCMSRVVPHQTFALPKEKGHAHRLRTAFGILSRRRPTFPRSYPRSIIGPARLNFRVRDGNGCDPRGMTTGNSWKSLVVHAQFQVEPRKNQELRNRFEKMLASPYGSADNRGWRLQVRPAAEHYCDIHKVVNPSPRRCDGATTG
jgi:hypothetical protein